MLLTFETIMFPSKDEKTFFMFCTFSFFTIAAIAGPFPEIDAVEVERGQPKGKPREKVTYVKEMLELLN